MTAGGFALGFSAMASTTTGTSTDGASPGRNGDSGNQEGCGGDYREDSEDAQAMPLLPVFFTTYMAASAAVMISWALLPSPG